ncbi:MAG TPA: Re/Si-specific NAD(P)(+) transhydrogenase subunit alpha [Casimicrobiaceae bacterium]|jgi:NAD(P) transhydrogenase subunit alpha|nr:Re/Si-specific NAD(P)(+) transhydrogenase subunit alpha [Casimicrobiaceae bacterium]
MIIGIPRETRAGETRVAATPETVKKLAASGKHSLVVESGAGILSSIPDADFQAAGARIGGAEEALGGDIVLKVRGPSAEELPRLKRGAMLVGLLNPFDSAALQSYAGTGVSGYALEWLPRITRAQSMDVLSSQANIAGYKAVVVAADTYGKFMPMLMTAAGTVKAARVLILGVGVAGLQAIATAKRLGAVIEASDVRPSVKDQVESLGAKWVDVPYANDEERKIAEGVGGYARPMPPEWMARQAGIIHERCKTVDILITTALIPGRPAPKLIKAEIVASMKPGAVIVDLAVEQGGNVEGSELDKIVLKNGVKIVGYANLPAQVAADASALYSRNVLNFLALSLNAKTGEFAVPKDDEIIKATLVCENGAVVPRTS